MQAKPRLKGYSFPFIIWMLLFFVFPSSLIVLVSFMDNQSWKDLTSFLNRTAPAFYNEGPIAAWQRALSDPVWSSLSFGTTAYRELLEARVLITTYRTFMISLIASIVCVLISLPAAYYISRSRHKDYWILLIALPFWTNFLLRIYAWISLLGNQGVINSFLTRIGLISRPLPMMYNNFSVTMISIYVALPFSVIPIYSAIEKFDFSLLEASEDLGASMAQSLWWIFFPGIRNGLISAGIFVFINTFGNYAVAKLVGGQGSYVLGTLVSHNATVGRNMPLAASISTVISFLALAMMLLSTAGRPQTLPQSKGGKYAAR